MSLESINYHPKMTAYLIEKGFFRDQKFTVVDVGARFGGASYWDVFNNQLSLIGFEPDKEECERLNQKFGQRGHRYFPVALHETKGKRTFYVTEYLSSSGFYRNEMSFWSRFPDEKNFKLKETLFIETTDFNTFGRENNINHIDFLKLDVEGAELDVLKGASDYLKNNGVLGALVEVRFQRSSNQPIFSEVDSFMESMDFNLFDVSTYRHSRKTLPGAFLEKDEKGRSIPGPSRKGQVIWANALYLRDGVDELHKGVNQLGWDVHRILKLACLFEIFDLSDCAIELLQQARDCFKDISIDYLINLLTPPLKGRNIPYSEYLKKREAGENDEGAFLISQLAKDIKSIGSYYLPASIKSFIIKTREKLR